MWEKHGRPGNRAGCVEMAWKRVSGRYGKGQEWAWKEASPFRYALRSTEYVQLIVWSMPVLKVGGHDLFIYCDLRRFSWWAKGSGFVRVVRHE